MKGFAFELLYFVSITAIELLLNRVSLLNSQAQTLPVLGLLSGHCRREIVKSMVGSQKFPRQIKTL